MLKRRMSAVLLALATFSCASPGPTAGGGRLPEVALDQQAAGSTVQLAQGQTLVLSLPGNPTTGFNWEVLEGAESVLALQGKPQYTPESDRIGAGGIFSFRFKVVKAGTASLRLVYRRSFGEAAPAKSFEMTVVAGKAE